MAKGSSSIQGLYFQWRKRRTSDAIRAFVTKDGEKPISISAKVHPDLKALNAFLHDKKLRKVDIRDNEDFKKLQHRFEQSIKSEYGLTMYKIMERLEIDSKVFDFTNSIMEFKAYKSDTSMPVDYEFYMVKFWLPFFASKKCTHPKEFKKFRNQAELHVRAAVKLDGSGERYSHNSYNMLCRTLNQYMEFCEKHDYISKDDKFKIWVTVTLEQQKQIKSKSGKSLRNIRDARTYSRDDLFKIKAKIDKRYDEKEWPLRGKEMHEKKLQAYCLFFGVITGLRRGNFCGLFVRDLHPDEQVPYFIVRDNIISGRSRGLKGYITQEDSTKTSAGEAITIPMVQPDLETITEVARFIKKHMKSDQRIFTKTPGYANKDWKIISMECNFTYLSSLAWRHSYATIGALNLKALYAANPYFLQRCCLHEDYRTTQGYIRKHAKQFLDVFGQAFAQVPEKR